MGIEKDNGTMWASSHKIAAIPHCCFNFYIIIKIWLL